MGDKKFVIGIVIATLVLLFGGIWVASRVGVVAEVAVNPEAKATAVETSYDWGTIGISDGVVEKVFSIQNTGSQPLTLSNIATSCMCTSAQLLLGDAVSPLFSMHTKSQYTMDVPPGGEAQLKVVFDPAFHGPSGVGPINRQATVATNDPAKPELTFILTAMVRK